MNWIKTKQFDLIFFIPVWFPFLFLVLLADPRQGGPLAAVPLVIYLLYHTVLRLPHFFITYPLVYLRERRALDWVLYFVVPALILAVYFLFAEWKLLVAMAVIWGWFHIGMQNYGFQNLYLRINQSRLRGDLSYKFIFLGFILSKVVQAVHLLVFANRSLAVFEFLLFALNLGLILSGLRLLYLKFFKFKEKWNTADWFLLLAVIMLLDWPALIGLSQLNYFYLFNAHHCLAYLGISYLLSRNEKSGTLSFKKLYPPLLAGSIAIVLLFLHFDPDFLKSHISDDSGFHPLFLGFFVVHYYLDGIAWKVRKDNLSFNRYIA